MPIILVPITRGVRCKHYSESYPVRSVFVKSCSDFRLSHCVCVCSQKHAPSLSLKIKRDLIEAAEGWSSKATILLEEFQVYLSTLCWLYLVQVATNCFGLLCTVNLHWSVSPRILAFCQEILVDAVYLAIAI